MIADKRFVINGFVLLGLLLLAACADATGVPGAAGADVIFADGFVPGQMGNWVIEGDNAGQTAVINEQLVIELADNNIMQFSTLPDQFFDNFILEVDATLLEGDLGSSYGVLFRMQDSTRFYRFEITGDGLFMVERRDGESGWTRFVDRWTEAPAINQGLGSSNQLRVEALGTNISLFVNDELVHQFSDTAYSSGTIALDAGTFVQPQAQVAFDNVVVRRP
ncbi:family 16 glycoside hydrolase [Candidatus Leptofilum sp.]|uniref:family 16 glycoside hydrolase n=1 Tax=Candidatus Leptofilum sp. TaxID=3241576 RepID=UPI003B5BB3E3